ncbi:MAG TPA: PDZ domain-containing protein [Blastocatellia bacterium]|nr:PDZ domain-containing protein [Blastocatellia bacterium]
MRKAIFILSLLLITSIIKISTGSLAQEKPLLMRQPAMSRTHIVFSYAGDLWIAPRNGGAASQLTDGVGNETSPQFSPDGTTVAFTGEYDGNVDLYTVPATGGVPKRMTYHPGADGLAGWTPDGKQLLFVSQRASDSGRFARLFTMPVDGVFPAEVPLPMAYAGSYSPDGTRLAYEPIPRAFNAWKRYRGGMASQIWIASLSDSSVEKIPRSDSNDFNPMWPKGEGDKVYFLSDRNGPISLFAYDTKTKKVTQLIQNNGLDIKSASAGPDGIIYEQFGSLGIYDLKSGKTKPVNITINGDMLSLRPKYEKVGTRISNAAISPTGARAVFEARGEIISVPAEKGDARNLTNTRGVAERDPAWSPDGKWIAYFSDESGEYALHLRDQKGMGEVKKINLGNPPSFFYSPTWSPDSKKIAYSDKRLNIWYLDIEKGQPVKVDTLSRGFSLAVNWSPDSRWLAYAKPLKSWYNAVFIYSLEDGKSAQITDGLSDALNPVFDKGGKYLYFTASTDIGPSVFGFDMSSYSHRTTRSVYVAVLKKTDSSPLAPESDEEKVAEEKSPEKPSEKPSEIKDGATGGQGDGAKEGEKKADGAQAAAAKSGEKKEPPKVTIDFDNISQRILALPPPNRNYVGLTAGKPNTLFIIEFPDGAQGATLHKFDLEKRKFDKALDNINGFDLSANSEKMLYRQQQNWFIAATATLGTPAFKPGEGRIKTEEMEVYVDPRAEWDQMYRETWRIERDFFYAPNYHGLDLQATAKKYEPYLASLAHRADLNYLFQEMLGELSVGHLYVQGGDTPDPKRVPGGLLGADYKIENGRYRFTRVYNGENWNPNLRAPLTQPGVNVVAGEYLLAVRGRNLTANDNIYSFFESTANKQVVIKVGPNPDGSGSREVTVVPIQNETGLRNLAWIEENRRKVDKMSDGKLAYIYLPDTAGGGYTFFNRYYFSQLDRQGAVVDERFNSGGQAADYVIDYLKKPLMSYWAVRDGDDWREPFGVMPGPKAMLINEYSGSGGDYLPYMFRRAQVDPLIGKRTWGGLVGIGGYPNLIDGGSVTAPHFAFYTPEGKWEIENHGVAPDVEVEFDPKSWREGRDVQLEKAVSWLMEELKKNPQNPVHRPPYPNYHNGTRASAGSGN